MHKAGGRDPLLIDDHTEQDHEAGNREQRIRILARNVAKRLRLNGTSTTGCRGLQNRIRHGRQPDEQWIAHGRRLSTRRPSSSTANVPQSCTPAGTSGSPAVRLPHSFSVAASLSKQPDRRAVG
jgi:hypothetical protein